MVKKGARLFHSPPPLMSQTAIQGLVQAIAEPA
jgi:hypothetical protein